MQVIVSESKQLLLALFDSSFTNLVTPRIAGALHRLAVSAAGLLAFLVAAGGLDEPPLASTGWILFAVLLFVVLVAVSRVGLEAALVFFRMAEDAQEIAEHEAAIALNTSQLGAPEPPVRESRSRHTVER